MEMYINSPLVSLLLWSQGIYLIADVEEYQKNVLDTFKTKLAK